MKRVLAVSGRFPHKLFSIVAVIALVAFLLTLDPVAKIVKKGVDALGITFPVMEVFKNVAANILIVALGYLLLTIAAVIIVPIVKICVTIAAVAIVAVGLYKLYNTFTGRATRYLLPMKGDGIKAKENGGYGDTDLTKK